jgi:hypothetical protein
MPAGTGLEREAVAHDTAIPNEPRDVLGDEETVGAARDLRRARHDLRRITDHRNLDDPIHVVALDLPGNARERHEVVRDDDHPVGVHRVGECEAQRPARRRPMRAVGIAEAVRSRRGDDGDVDVHVAILDRLPAATVRSQHAETGHAAARSKIAQRTIHAALDVMHDAAPHQVDDGRMHRTGRVPPV